MFKFAREKMQIVSQQLDVTIMCPFVIFLRRPTGVYGVLLDIT